MRSIQDFDVIRGINPIKQRIKERINDTLTYITQNRLPITLSVIFDIDDTLMRNDEDNNDPSICRTRAICNFIKYLKYGPQQNYIRIYIVTARSDRWVNDTQLDLLKKGIVPRADLKDRRKEIPYDGLFLRPSDQESSIFKHAIRKKILNQGEQILLTVGDMWWDHMCNDMERITDEFDYKYGNVDLLVYPGSETSLMAWKLPSA